MHELRLGAIMPLEVKSCCLMSTHQVPGLGTFSTSRGDRFSISIPHKWKLRFRSLLAGSASGLYNSGKLSHGGGSFRDELPVAR